ncbi:hypothetical protein FI667_g10930, partial [Globisporangium splendens]
MADKIGKYFAEQEAQLRRAYVQAAASAATVQQQHQSLYLGASRPTAIMRNSRRHPQLQQVHPIRHTCHLGGTLQESDSPHLCSGNDSRCKRMVEERAESAILCQSGKPSNKHDSSHDDTSGDHLNKPSTSEPSKDDSKPAKLLRRRSSIRKKRRSSSLKTGNNEPDPEQIRREKEQKVAAALALAQERAKRIELEREQHLRD